MKVLIGAFYGYTLHVRGQFQHILDSYQEQGHFGLAKLLESPYIDFICSPTFFEFRENGLGYSLFASPQTSVQLHGKLWMDENDYVTHLKGWRRSYGRTENYEESEAVQLRQLSNEILHASGAWWFDMGGGWYDSEPMLNLIKKLNAIGERSIDFDRTSNSEIAVVVDEYSNYMMRMDKRLSCPQIFFQVLPLGRIGAPVDYILQDDLDLAKPYKLYIFLNAFHVSDKQREMIQKLPERGAQAFLWIYAPGYAGDTLDIQGCCDLTGLNISSKESEGQLLVKINHNGSHILPGVKEGAMYGTRDAGVRNMIGPIFYGDDPSAEVLGDLYSHELPGLITKKVNGIQAYYSAAPLLSAEVLRGIAARSGVHIYNFRDDVLYANNSFIAVHTAESGTRTLRFPEKTSLYDVYHDREIGRDINHIDIDMANRKTFLYFMGTKEEWNGNHGHAK